MRRVCLWLVLALLLAACGTDDQQAWGQRDGRAPLPASLTSGAVRAFPPAPEVPTGPLDPAIAENLEIAFNPATGQDALDGFWGFVRNNTDSRVLWLYTDLLRFLGPSDERSALIFSFNQLAGVTLDSNDEWGNATDLLIAWDLPAPPDYQDYKGALFTSLEPGWQPFFDDTEADIDWRLLSWGGVRIDGRPLDETNFPCPSGCIPALNDPAVTNAAGGGWYPDDAVIFGLNINGEARAYPRNLMEVHEMVNDTLGGRRVGIPYCTLCGSAQAYFTDTPVDGIETPTGTYELRTSGLLTRSNKVMYEFHTDSVFDTFTGEAVSGPLREAGERLEQVSIVTTTWGEWKAAHPSTTILPEISPWGSPYELDPLGGRDDDGPIFPIGDVDSTLGVHESVVGVLGPDGIAIAFPATAAEAVLADGGTVSLGGVDVIMDAGGLRAVDSSGASIASHQAFWFAWSQFHPDTLLWVPAV